MPTSPVKKRLTRKQRKFVDEFVSTGNGTQAALEAYDTTKPNVAAVISTENLKKPNVQHELTERLSLEMVEEAHESLLSAVRLDYFVFPRSMSDEEITEHVEAQGLTVLNIRPSDKGKLAFFSLPDGASRGKGIELYHKVKGTFAPDKSINVNVEVEASEEVKRAAQFLNEHYRHLNSGASNGVVSGDVGSQTQDTQ